MKVLSLFSGIGAFEKALTNMGVKYELVNYCEIDKYASKSYSAIHNVPESKNLGDITKVDTSKLPNDIDLLTYGFPCQDISLAGRQRGFEHEGERTRSGLFFEALRLIEDLQPKFAICENVKNLTSKKFEKEFDIVLSSLEEAGYKNYWKVLNAKDYGIPQNRERVFIISIREDIDKGYKFPEPFELKLRLKDLLDSSVDEKYYLSEKMIKYISQVGTGKFKNPDSKINLDIARPLTTDQGKRAGTTNYERTGTMGATGVVVREATKQGYASNYISSDLPDNYDLKDTVKQIANVCPTKNRVNPNQGRVYDTDYIAPALNCMEGGNRQPMIPVREATKQGYAEAYEGDCINLEQPNSKTRRGRVGRGVAQTLTTSPQQGVVTSAAMRGRYNDNGQVEQSIEVSDREISNALTTVQKDSLISNNLRIRKLTPLECFRLMGFSDDDYYKAERVNSNTQLYKQAGNSIVVDVIEEIYEQLFELYWNEVK